MDRADVSHARISLQVLRGRASRASLQGVFIAVGAVLLATMAVTYLTAQGVSLDGVVQVQRTNFALWVLDLRRFPGNTIPAAPIP
ncbi:hypothetical protein [Thiocystis violacea]|uniref:hypothetical protein n=1 Tax=Thiocystis violacea TaxID=13725 RepID=UPI001905E843|nr:hypothetical protein [Thiocystis violacea]